MFIIYPERIAKHYDIEINFENLDEKTFQHHLISVKK